MISNVDNAVPTNYIPELRQHPPWLMEEMLAAEPSLAIPILGSTAIASDIATLVRAALLEKSPVVVTGCGTSETAAMAVADLLAEALKHQGFGYSAVHVRQALEASQDPWPAGVCIGISHDGSTHATILAMRAARDAGATTALMTARPQSAAFAAADHTFVTPVIDRSWCHTVGYLSPILAGAAIARSLRGSTVNPGTLAQAMNDALGVAPQADAVARTLFGVTRLIIVGTGSDRSPARELALKIEEGVWLPARMLELETTLHGHLAACDKQAGLVVVATAAQGPSAARTQTVIEAARRIGMKVGAIVSSTVNQQFANVDRIVLPLSLEPHGLLGRFAGAALALQQLTIALGRLAGVNPDLIRRQHEPYREAARIVDSTSW